MLDRMIEINLCGKNKASILSADLTNEKQCRAVQIWNRREHDVILPLNCLYGEQWYFGMAIFKDGITWICR